MIMLTGLNNKQYYLNCDLIERIDVTPDTIISTTNNKKLIVKESPEVIIQRIIDFKASFMTHKPEVIRNEQA